MTLFSRTVPFAIATAAFLLLTCATPQNPFQDDANASLELRLEAAPTQGFLINDTLDLSVICKLPRFFDSVKVSFNDYWDTAIAVISQATFDTITCRHVLEQTGAATILVTSVMNKGTSRQQSALVNVTGRAPVVIRDLSPLTSIVTGKDLSISISATGTEPITYSWTRNGVPITGVNVSIYTKTGIHQSDSGIYRCVVSNPWGIDSSSATFVLVSPGGTPDAPLGLHIVSRSGGTVALMWTSAPGAEGYRIYRDTAFKAGIPAIAQIIDTSYLARDTGRFYYWVTTMKNGLESPASSPVLVAPIDTTRPPSPPHWVRDTIGITLAEGDSFSINLADSCIDTNQTPMLIISPLGNRVKGRITANGLYNIAAGRRDSGLYTDSILATDGALKDTLLFKIRIIATFCTLTTSASHGRVSATPSTSVFRWSDSVSLAAIPDSGYEFSSWSGAVVSNNFAISIIMDSSKALTANFAKLPDCSTVPAGASINQAIAQHKGASARPAVICPDPGVYDNNTIGIHGKVKFTIQ